MNLVICAILGACVASAQVKSEDVLQKRTRRAITLAESSAEDAFKEVMMSVGVPGGIVELERCGVTPRTRFDIPEGTTLEAALYMVISGDSAWSWTIEDGVANLMQGSPELLQTRIARFSWDTTQSVNLALSNLTQLPEITQKYDWVGQVVHVSSELGGMPIGPPPPPPPPDPREVRDLTVQSALNRIVTSFGSDVWFYGESMCTGTRTFTLVAVVKGFGRLGAN